MMEVVKLLQKYPTKSNEEISEIINQNKNPRYIKRIRYTLNKATDETIQYIKNNCHKSPAEIDKELKFESGTTNRICKIFNIQMKKKRSNSWSEKEIEFVKLYYPTLGRKETAKRLGISETRVRVLAHELGIKRDYQYTDDEAEDIMLSYLFGETVHSIATRYNRTTQAIYNFLYRREIQNPENTCSPYYVTSTERYIIDYLNQHLNANIPDKTKEENRSYFWNVVKDYEIDVPVYIDNFKFAIEYDGQIWHENKKDHDIKKDKALRKAGFIVYRIKSEDHKNNYYDLTSMNPILDDIVEEIKIITGSR